MAFKLADYFGSSARLILPETSGRHYKSYVAFRTRKSIVSNSRKAIHLFHCVSLQKPFQYFFFQTIFGTYEPETRSWRIQNEALLQITESSIDTISWIGAIINWYCPHCLTSFSFSFSFFLEISSILKSENVRGEKQVDIYAPSLATAYVPAE